jgi:eukaryotic-like serine/threonine-protein kinase
VDGRRMFFIAMELLEGVPLSKLVSGGRALVPLRAVHIAMQICRSLREAHKAGVVHRDLKPGNVMIVRQDDVDDIEGDFVKVLDFGLAKVTPAPGRPGFDGAKPIDGVTKAGTFMGSPRYVAPEQVEGRVVDPRADIYSFACVMYRLLSGHVVFDGKSPVEIMLKHVNEPPPRLEVAALPRTLIDLVMQCLEKDPDDRPRSMDEVLVRLKLARAELGGSASGIVVVSDERFSIPEGIAVSEPPGPMPEGVVTRVDRPKVEAPKRDAPFVDRSNELPPRPQQPTELQPGTDPRMAGTETDWALGTLDRPIKIDDSTRPTKIFGHVTAMSRPTRRPWAAMSFGALFGLLVLAAIVAWRTGRLDEMLARARGFGAARDAPPVVAPPGPSGPLAKAARLRIVTDPAGADVLEEKDGLPRLLGVTPLTLDWDIVASPAPRKLVLRKEGFVPAVANVAPPPEGSAPVVSLDVEAALRPEAKR